MPNGAMPMPARTLLQKLSVAEAPAWASYLPAGMQEQFSKKPHVSHEPHEHPPAQKKPVAGEIWEMSQDPKGCRELQQAMERNRNSELLESVGHELVGHVAESIRCPYANHVLQLYITMARSEKLQFVLDELLSCPGGVEFAAKHKFGCRVVQRLMEHLPPAQAEELAEAILGAILDLGRHPYGNYVLQNLLEHGTSDQKKRLALGIQHAIAPMCQDHFGSAVVSTALCKLASEDMLQLSRSILHAPGLLVFLAHSRHGHTTVRHILCGVEGAELSLAQELLEAEVASLQASRYGRAVVGWLQDSRSFNLRNGSR